MSHEMTRRALIASLMSSVSTAALARSPLRFHGGHEQSGSVGPPPGPDLVVTLAFRDGKSLVFSQDTATDIGDYVGPFVHQKCFRQIASGHGDYRDAFLVDFRPDADGLRNEIVVEFGTLFNFPSVGAPTTASGVTPLHLGVPPNSVVTKTTGNTSTQDGVVYCSVTYDTPDGETPANVLGLVLTPGQRIIVQSPPAHMNATGYNVYAALSDPTTGDPDTSQYIPILQNDDPIPLGVDWTEPTTGLILAGTPQIPNSRPSSIAYLATISGGGLVTPVVISVPTHWWCARWRWQSAARPIVRTLANLVAVKAVLPLELPYAYNAGVPPLRTWEGPMDHGPVERGMSGAGGRPDLGFFTEWAAAYLLLGTASTETTMRAAAEATGSIVWWARDAATGALVNTATVPRYPAFSDAFHGPQAIPLATSSLRTWAYITPNESHMPALGFVPWMLTDDPYYLEGVQAASNYSILESNLYRNGESSKSLPSPISPRAWAWGTRDIFQLAGFSPATVPSWLLPRSYWRDTVVPALTAYVTKHITAAAVTGASPALSVFNLFITTTVTHGFIQEYECIVAGWIKWTGLFPAYDPCVEYMTKVRITMSDPADTSGWDHRLPEPYYMPVSDARRGALANGAHTGEAYLIQNSANTPTSFAELFADYKLWAAAKGYTYDPSTWPADGLAARDGYSPWERAALAALSLAGVPRAREGHDWLAAQLVKDHNFGSIGYTWAIPPD